MIRNRILNELYKLTENTKHMLHFSFKCTDADEDGVFLDTPWGEIDTNDFSQFIQHMENYEITRTEFDDRFELPNYSVIENAIPKYLQFYDDSEKSGFVVVFDGDTHFIYKV